MLVGLFADVDGRPVRDDVYALQQTSRVELTRLAVWPKALRFWVVLVGVQEHEEILRKYLTTVVFIRKLVNGRLGIVDIDALRMHPLVAFG